MYTWGNSQSSVVERYEGENGFYFIFTSQASLSKRTFRQI